MFRGSFRPQKSQALKSDFETMIATDYRPKTSKFVSNTVRDAFLKYYKEHTWISAEKHENAIVPESKRKRFFPSTLSD